MSAIQTRPTRLGAFLKKELWTEEAYCREVLTVTIADIGTAVGVVVVDDGASGTFAAIPVAATAIISSDPVAIIIDQDVEAKIAAAVAASSSTAELLALVKGPAVIAKSGVTYGTLAYGSNEALVDANLVASGINITTKFS